MKNRIKIGLFGFGRIGRNIFRLGFNNPAIQFQAISDYGGPEAMHYLLMRDSIHGAMKEKILLDGQSLIYNGSTVRLLAGGKPGTVPWDALDVDLVIDSTGVYRLREELHPHLDSGASRILVSKPPSDEIDRIVIKLSLIHI